MTNISKYETEGLSYVSYRPTGSVSHPVSQIVKEAHRRLLDKGFSLYDAA